MAYTMLFESYTHKQWTEPSRHLGPKSRRKISVQDDFDERYFSYWFQALPIAQPLQQTDRHTHIHTHTHTHTHTLTHPHTHTLTHTHTHTHTSFINIGKEADILC